MSAYSSNEIVDIILVLGEAERNYCKAERCIVIDIRLDDPNIMQIRRILRDFIRA